ncbi:hypothetical protein EYR38_003216 [Pleurotus pulmonarius]|nr:hypothetical protein EYR38_003216 [Pleurotus pulmonarius]
MLAKKGKVKGKGKSGKRRGRKPWAEGSKLEFLLSFEEEYLQTADPGGIYTRMTVQFLEKYGYDLPFDSEPEEGVVPVIPNLADLPYDQQTAEQAKRDAIYMKLRLKIGNWMRHRFHRKQTDEDMVADLLETMSQLSIERPRRRTAMNIYWAENYGTKIRKEFQQYWKTAKLTAPPDSRMSMCADYVKARYDDETEEYRCALEKRADAEYKQAMDEYNSRDALDGTPEAYAHAWSEADNFLHVFVDAIAKKFGMSVSLLMTGPLGSEGGKIVMRSAHSNNVGAMTSLIWPEFDKTGFKAVQDSIVRYGEAVFSPEECKRRIPRSPLDLERASTASPDLNHINNTANGPTMSLDGDPCPSLDDPMTLIADGDADDTMNVGMPVTSRQPQGEFTALLTDDWDWGNTLTWGGNTSQNPSLWNNAVPAPYGPGPSTMPGMPILANGPNVPVAPAMPTMPVGGISIPATLMTIPAPAPIVSQDNGGTPMTIPAHGGVAIPALPMTIPAHGGISIPAPPMTIPAPSQDNGGTTTMIPAHGGISIPATPMTSPAPASLVYQDHVGISIPATPMTSPAPAPMTSPAPAPMTSPAPAPMTSPAPAPMTSPAPAPMTSPAPAPIVSQDNGGMPTIILAHGGISVSATPMTIPAPAPIVSQDNGATTTRIPAPTNPAPVPISPPSQDRGDQDSTTIAASIVTQERGGVSISTPAAPSATLSQSTPATRGDHEGSSIPDSSLTTTTPTPVSPQPTITQPASTPHSTITPAASTPDSMPITPEVDPVPSMASATSAAASSAVASSVPTVPNADPSIASSMTPPGPASLGKENETPPEKKRKRAKCQVEFLNTIKRIASAVVGTGPGQIGHAGFAFQYMFNTKEGRRKCGGFGLGECETFAADDDFKQAFMPIFERFANEHVTLPPIVNPYEGLFPRHHSGHFLLPEYEEGEPNYRKKVKEFLDASWYHAFALTDDIPSDIPWEDIYRTPASFFVDTILPPGFVFDRIETLKFLGLIGFAERIRQAQQFEPPTVFRGSAEIRLALQDGNASPKEVPDSDNEATIISSTATHQMASSSHTGPLPPSGIDIPPPALTTTNTSEPPHVASFATPVVVASTTSATLPVLASPNAATTATMTTGVMSANQAAPHDTVHAEARTTGLPAIVVATEPRANAARVETTTINLAAAVVADVRADTVHTETLMNTPSATIDADPHATTPTSPNRATVTQLLSPMTPLSPLPTTPLAKSTKKRKISESVTLEDSAPAPKARTKKVKVSKASDNHPAKPAGDSDEQAAMRRSGRQRKPAVVGYDSARVSARVSTAPKACKPSWSYEPR